MLPTTTERKPMLSYFVPENLKLSSEKNEMGLCQLITACALEAIHLLEQGDLIQLDAHAGNYGCEAHSFRLLHLARLRELRVECAALRPLCEANLDALRNRDAQPHAQKMHYKAFLKTMVSHLDATPEMGYLVLSRLLTITKKMCADAAGYETEKTDHSQLLRLASRVEDQYRAEVVAFAQAFLSKYSIQFLGSQVPRYSIVDGEEKQLIGRMFEKSNLLEYSGIKAEKKQPRLKTFSCAYYTVKAVLLHLRESNTPIVVKPLHKIGEEPSPGLIFRAVEPGGHFVRFGEAEKLETTEPVIVCEGITALKLSELAEIINQYGLEKILLANAALGEQYVPHHPEFQVKDQKAQEEIGYWRQGADDLQKLFNFVHMYCNTRGKEAVSSASGGQSR
ncbi:MAG: hypothetical protein LLG04_00350 [Parachlamydia sp.]|nr:hypothetical protein [Parachlamydia sp.]